MASEEKGPEEAEVNKDEGGDGDDDGDGDEEEEAGEGEQDGLRKTKGKTTR